MMRESRPEGAVLPATAVRFREVQGPPGGDGPPGPRFQVFTPRAPQPIIDALNGQIAAERATIDALTKQLDPGMSEAREEAVTSQLEAAQERLTSLQGQLDNALGVSRVRADVRPPVPPFRTGDYDVPERAADLAYGFFATVAIVSIGIPLARAFGRRVDRGNQVAIARAAAPNVEPRFDRMEQAMEAIAIEIERISEGQRYTNKLMGEMRALPQPGAAEQWPRGTVKEAVPLEQRRD